MAISPPAPLAGAPLSRRLADTQSSPVRELLEQAMQPHIISLAGGLPAPDTFDVLGLRAAFDEVLSGPQAIRALQYSKTEGDTALRERLAAFMCTRGLDVTGDDLLITTGSQQALGLVASALLDPGDTILVEDPTYLAALQTFQLADLVAHAIPGDDEGPDPEALIEQARATGAKVAYLIPTFQNPTGRTIGPARRAALAEAAATAGLWLVEDDPYSALRLDGEDVDLLAAQPAARDRTIVIQTLSKVLSPGLRIGYLRAPAALRGPLTVAKQAADLHTSTVAQLAAERWLATHDLATHIAGLEAHYRPRRDALVTRAARAPAERVADERARGRPVHLGRAARGPRHRGDPRAGTRTRGRVRPRLLLLRRRAAPQHAAGLVRDGHARRAARGRRPTRSGDRGVGTP